MKRQVSVIGASSCDADVGAQAEAVGKGLAEAGFAIVCGGFGGVMEAASRGAAEAGGDVIGILQGVDGSEANPHCTHVVATGIGQARNLAVVASGEAIVAIGGEWGTLSEIGFARKLDRPVIALGSWKVSGAGAMADGPGVQVVDDPAAAVAAVLAAVG